MKSDEFIASISEDIDGSIDNQKFEKEKAEE